MGQQKTDLDQKPQSPAGLLREVPRNVWVLTVTSFLNDISSEMVFNLLPLFLANVLGVRLGVIGLVEGTIETSASILKAYSGWLSDRLQKRKRLALAGYSLSALVKPLLYLASTWWMVLTLRFVDRVGKGIRTSPRDALIADSAPEHQRGLAFGLHRAGDTAGAALGLLVAMVLIWFTQGGQLDLERSTFQLLALLSAIPAFLAIIVLALGAQDVVPKDKKQVSAQSGLSIRALGPGFHMFLAAVALFALGNSSDAFIILRAQERGLSVLGILGMLLSFNLVYALISGPAGALSDKVGRRKLLIVSWLAYAIIYLGFAVAREVWHVWLLFAFYGIYYGTTEGVSKAMVADLVASSVRGTAYGVYNAALGLAAFPASLIAGLLWQGIGSWQGFGPGAPFLFGALLSLAAAVLLISFPSYGNPDDLSE